MFYLLGWMLWWVIVLRFIKFFVRMWAVLVSLNFLAK